MAMTAMTSGNDNADCTDQDGDYFDDDDNDEVGDWQ